MGRSDSALVESFNRVLLSGRSLVFSYPTVHTQQSTVPPGVAEHNVTVARAFTKLMGASSVVSLLSLIIAMTSLSAQVSQTALPQRNKCTFACEVRENVCVMSLHAVSRRSMTEGACDAQTCFGDLSRKAAS